MYSCSCRLKFLLVTEAFQNEVQSCYEYRLAPSIQSSWCMCSMRPSTPLFTLPAALWLDEAGPFSRVSCVVHVDADDLGEEVHGLGALFALSDAG